MPGLVTTDKTTTKQIIKLYVKTSSENRRDVLLSLLTPIGAILTNVGVPYFASKALVSSFSNKGNFGHYMAWLIVLAIAGIFANRIGFTTLMDLQAKTAAKLHKRVFNKVLSRGITFHTNQIGGKLVSDALDFVSAYGTLLMAVYNSAFTLAAILLSGLVIIYFNSWQLGIFLTATVLIIFFWAYQESIHRNELRTTRLEATRRLTGHLSDSIVNAQTVKTFAGEVVEGERNKRLNARLAELRSRDWQRAARSGSNRVIFILTMMILMQFLVHRLSAGNPQLLSVGIFSFTYTFTLLMRLFDINTIARQAEEAFLQASPMMNVLSEEDEIRDSADAKDLQVVKGEILLKNVGFTYTDENGTQEVFSNLNLDIQSGEKVGLVGPSGGGKTTLTRLILRFEDIQNGSIAIDHQDIRDITQASLRQQVAYVPQEPLLFHRTIEENIAYGRPNANKQDVIRAAKLAYAHTFIESLPNKYQTIVGERGVKLSGGQRQRVAIARAILKDSPILIFDEATSALDSESEKVIQDAMKELMKGKTAIVVAHRLSTIQKMDRIVVLDEGKIIEEGTHQQLLKKKGKYAELWAHQSGGFIEE